MEQVVTLVRPLGQREGVQDALQTDDQGEGQEECRRRRAHQQRQGPRQPQDQNGQGRHQEAGRKAVAEDPVGVQAIQSRPWRRRNTERRPIAGRGILRG